MASKDKKPVRSTSGSRPAGGIRTLADLNRRSGPDSDSDDDNAPQEYYTGGQKSGMMVQEPSKPNDVDEIFSLARQQGAIDGGSLQNLQPSSSTTFTGTGRLLSGGMFPPASQPPETVLHNIVFWRNGFSINDGPLRRLDDPDNASFMESIRRSECPNELEPAEKNTVVDVNLIRRDVNYPEPEKHTLAFQGVGRTLGSSSAPPTSEQNTSAATAPLTTAPPPSAGLIVDEAQPSTPIQLRLADGTRMVAHFNYHHTIGDIRAFIDASRPGGSTTYQLQTVGFPPKLLNDLNQTIEQAGLANSVVIQKL